MIRNLTFYFFNTEKHCDGVGLALSIGCNLLSRLSVFCNRNRQVVPRLVGSDSSRFGRQQRTRDLGRVADQQCGAVGGDCQVRWAPSFSGRFLQEAVVHRDLPIPAGASLAGKRQVL